MCKVFYFLFFTLASHNVCGQPGLNPEICRTFIVNLRIKVGSPKFTRSSSGSTQRLLQ